MKGLELSRLYYEQFGKKMIEEQFGEYADRITVGLAGEGSECLGFDDEISTDHDFEPGFCMWIDEADERIFGFKLERAYARLPKEFMGYSRQILAPAGGRRKGVLVSENFCERFLGTEGVSRPLTLTEWMRLPSEALAAFSSGEIFKEGNNKFSSARKEILKGYPLDVKKKKLASALSFIAQSGCYNYKRCLEHGENGGAQLAIFEFIDNATKAIYILNDKYRPFYKWIFRGMRELEVFSELEEPLVFLTESGNDKKTAEYKTGIIEDVTNAIITELKRRKLTDATCMNPDTHAFSVNDKIEDATLRNMHIMIDGR